MSARAYGWLRVCLVAISAWLMTASPAAAQSGNGAALVVGNATYRSAPALKRAKQDATEIAAALRAAGLVVTVAGDLDARGLRTQVEAFARSIPAGGSAFLYWRGHTVQAPARNRSEGFDNWLLGIDEAGPSISGLSLGDVLALLNGAGVVRQVVVIDAAPPLPGLPVGLVEPGARALRSTVVMLGSAPGDAPTPESVLAPALAAVIASSASPAGEAMLRVAAAVSAKSGGKQRPLVAGSGASARWVLNPSAKAVVTPDAPAPPEGDLQRYNRAVACGTETCLTDAISNVRGSLRADLERRLAELVSLDDFDPGAPTGTAAARTRLGPAQQAVVEVLSKNAGGKYRLGIMFLRGAGGFPADDELAFTWFTRATQFEYGPAVPNDPEEWYRRKAAFVVGWFYHSGRRPVQKDAAKALSQWGNGYSIEMMDGDTAWYTGVYAQQCLGGMFFCFPQSVQEAFERARSMGITRARTPLDPDFPVEAPRR